MNVDRYNPNGTASLIAQSAEVYRHVALVNKGNCLFSASNFEGARDYYIEALTVESLCVEAVYNLGLCVHRHMAAIPLLTYRSGLTQAKSARACS